MDKIVIKRTYKDNCTLGDASVLDDKNNTLFTFKTLELPWLDNKRGISCIEEGIYTCQKNTWQPKFGNHFDILNTRNRAGVKIHSGNFTHQIRGCILVGSKHLFLDKDKITDISESKLTLAYLFKIMPDKFILEIQ